jgi:CheY-like chemotaxis protein
MRAAPSLRAPRSTLVLLVDDNTHGLLARKTVLEELGYKVISATSGVVALELTEKHDFDLIVTDYRMPLMDGIVLIRTLRQRNFKKPIILLSGFLAHLGLTEQSTGADLLIQKCSSEMDQLVRGVKRLLNVPKKPASSQGRATLKKHRAI